MSLLQKERDVITRNEYADTFDFDEIENFITNAPKELFITHHFKKRDRVLVQPRGGFPTYKKMFELYETFMGADIDVLPLKYQIESNNNFIHKR